VPVREFAYGVKAPWPAGANGSGASISFLPDTELTAQGDGQQWRAGPATPAAANQFPAGWGAWTENYFDPLAADFAVVSAPSVDADGDGQANVVEYVLGSSPAAAASVGALETGTVEAAGQEYFTISFLHRPDVTTLPEVSSALESWVGASLVEVARVPQPDGSERVTLRDTTPLGSQPGRFLHLRVTKP
jgi:hypothetical protein